MKKYEALLSNNRHGVQRDKKWIYIAVRVLYPLGKVAAKHILDNIKASYGTAAGIVANIKTFTEDTGKR